MDKLEASLASIPAMNEPILLDSISDKVKQADESDSNQCDRSYLKDDELAILGDCRDLDSPQRLSNQPACFG